MNYSSSIRSLCKEVARLKSYSRLNPVLRIITLILMLPFIALAASATAVFYVLLFFRNGSQIAVDELEAWLNKRKEGVHCAPESVLYFVTIPFIFFLRVLITLFSGFLYFIWFTIMCGTYVASLGGIRWQPYLNYVSYDEEYAWSFKHSRTTFNVFALVNIGFILLCVIQALLGENGLTPWLAILTVFMVYIVYPNMFTKKNVRPLNAPEAIYTEATEYAEVMCLANYKRATALIAKIPEYENASELAEAYNTYFDIRSRKRAKVGKILMIITAAIIAAAVLVPIAVNAVLDSIDNSRNLVYYEDKGKECSVSCNSYSVLNVTIEETYKKNDVTMIRDNAFDGCTMLRSVKIPSTITSIGSNAFRDCESLKKIVYDGTIIEWQQISKAAGWDDNIGRYVVVCTDGEYDPYYVFSEYEYESDYEYGW